MVFVCHKKLNNFYNLLESSIKTYQQRDDFYTKVKDIRDALSTLKFKFINTDQNSIINKCQQILKPEAYKFLSYEKTKKLEEFNDKSLEDIKINNIKHQYGNSECGVYAMYYITQRLSGNNFEKITSNIIKDREIKKFRKHFFIQLP